MIGDDRIEVQAGSDYPYSASARVNGLDPLVLAWLTLKPYPEGVNQADPGALQKIVTTTLVAGQGQITDDGTTDGAATIFFDVTADDTTALGARDYQFDAKVRTASGLEWFAARGLWTNVGSYTLSR